MAHSADDPDHRLNGPAFLHYVDPSDPEAFDRLYQDGATTPRVMAISIHPYLTGAPHRIKYLEALYDHILGHDGVVMWTGEEILDWYLSQTATT